MQLSSITASAKAALPEDLFSAMSAPPAAVHPTAMPAYAAQPGYAPQAPQPGQLPYGAPGGAQLGVAPAFAAFQQPVQSGYAQSGGFGMSEASGGGVPAFEADQSLFSSTPPAHVGDLGLTGKSATADGGVSSSGPDPFAGLGF